LWELVDPCITSVRRRRLKDVIVISLSTVEYTSVSRVYSTVDSDITYLIGLVDCLERRLVLTVGCMCPVKREEGSCECKC